MSSEFSPGGLFMYKKLGVFPRGRSAKLEKLGKGREKSKKLFLTGIIKLSLLYNL